MKSNSARFGAYKIKLGTYSKLLLIRSQWNFEILSSYQSDRIKKKASKALQVKPTFIDQYSSDGLALFLLRSSLCKHVLEGTNVFKRRSTAIASLSKWSHCWEACPCSSNSSAEMLHQMLLVLQQPGCSVSKWVQKSSEQYLFVYKIFRRCPRDQSRFLGTAFSTVEGFETGTRRLWEELSWILDLLQILVQTIRRIVQKTDFIEHSSKLSVTGDWYISNLSPKFNCTKAACQLRSLFKYRSPLSFFFCMLYHYKWHWLTIITHAFTLPYKYFSSAN